MDGIMVSIIIPIYNAEKYLAECMESILSQTYRNIEIICVDDGSTDKSAEMIKVFQEKDKRIRLVQQENQYAGVARNHGFDRAKGRYVMFLDADDYFDRFLIEKMVSAIHENSADIAVCASGGFDEESKKVHELAGALKFDLLPEKDVFSKKDIPEHIFQLTAGWAWDKMYRAEFIRENQIRFQNIRAANDELFVDIAYAQAERITAVKEALVTHRTNVVSSIEYTRERYWRCGYDMLIAEKRELDRRGLFQELERSFVNRAAVYITWNVCSITDPVFFSEFYTYFQKEAGRELGFSNYPEQYYDDPFTYETITGMGRYSEKEFLCGRVKKLNKTVEDRDAYVQELLFDIATIREAAEQIRWMRYGKRWRFPEQLIPAKSKIVFYGFGEVGRDWYHDIQRSEDLDLVMVVDKNYKKFQGESVKVHPIEDIKKVDYDYVLITIIEEKIAEKVRNFLIDQGILPEKILWFNRTERAENKWQF